MKALTERQQKVLAFISNSIAIRGCAPTLREIGEHMGIRSTNGVNDHLRSLERKGYLTHEDKKSRTLRPLEPDETSAMSSAPLRPRTDRSQAADPQTLPDALQLVSELRIENAKLRAQLYRVRAAAVDTSR